MMPATKQQAQAMKDELEQSITNGNATLAEREKSLERAQRALQLRDLIIELLVIEWGIVE